MPKTVIALELIKPNGTEEMQSLDVSDSVVGFAAFDDATTVILWSVEGADVRVRFDGTGPDGDTGHLFENGAFGIWPIALAKSAKFIRDTSVDAVISASQMVGGA